MKEKKLLLATMALPLFFAACSSEDLITEVQGNDLYPGVAKVDATFGIDMNTESRLATKWELENNDLVGLAWLGDETNVTIDGKAYQNHPLYALGTGSSAVLKPKTSIYVGKYFSYAPYDYATKAVGNIGFSVAEQALVADVNDAAYQAAAAKSIWISPKWTIVTAEGVTENDETYNDAGIENNFKMYPRKFSNLVKMVLEYENNILELAETPDIKKVVVSYLDADDNDVTNNSFTYAPNTAAHTTNVVVGDYFWNGMKIAATGNGVTVTPGNITLTGTVLADGNGDTYFFNALPASNDGAAKVKLEITTTYGVVTIVKPLSEIANTYVQDDTKKEGYKVYFDGQTVTTGGNKVSGVAVTSSFVNNLGFNGTLQTKVDFLTAKMDGMHVANDTELQKMLNYYKNYKKGKTDYSEAKSGTDIKLYLEGKNGGNFELSKTSIALIQEINKDCTDELLVSIQKCTSSDESCKSCNSIIITGGGEVPELNNVFENNVVVALSKEEWTWTNTPVVESGDLNAEGTGKNFGKVTMIFLLKNTSLTLSNGNIKAVGDNFTQLKNLGGEIIVDAVANIKFDVVNYGKITINKNAEMLAYGATITNESLADMSSEDITATIYNYQIINNGVLGVVKNTNGEIHNYGYIKNGKDARTYITTNQTDNASFTDEWSFNNKIGTIELTGMFDNVSVSNGTSEGFIKYTWTGSSLYKTPEPTVDVKYNYLIVEDNIEFTEFEEEVEYLEVAEGSNIVITAVNAFIQVSQVDLCGFPPCT